MLTGGSSSGHISEPRENLRSQLFDGAGRAESCHRQGDFFIFTFKIACLSAFPKIGR